MLFKRTVLLAVLLSLAVCDLCAFDFSYGSFFTVKGIENKKGKILLPLSRGEYANIRILTAEIHQFLASCKEDCSFDIKNAPFSVYALRAAKKRKNMWIADVKWGEDWLITFLIFKNSEGCSAVIPENFIFLSDELKNQVEQQLFSAVFACMTKQDLTQ